MVPSTSLALETPPWHESSQRGAGTIPNLQSIIAASAQMFRQSMGACSLPGGLLQPGQSKPVPGKEPVPGKVVPGKGSRGKKGTGKESDPGRSW